MRKIIDLNRGWLFSKDGGSAPKELPSGWQKVDLPHTWNAEDGQDGGGDYFRGRALYVKQISKGTLPLAEKYYLDIKSDIQMSMSVSNKNYRFEYFLSLI